MNNDQTLENAVYIPSLEASQIYAHIYRNQPIYLKHVGMIPRSLELQALMRNGLKLIPNKRKKCKSNDLISVQFNSKVRDAHEIEANYQKKIEETEKQIAKLKAMNLTKKKDKQRIEEKILKKKDYIKSLEKSIKDVNPDWEEIDNKKLREQLYKEGFTLKVTGYKTGEIIDEISYKVYKRSTAKSRTGSVLFIREQLHDPMIKWSRMGIEFNNKDEIDYVSLLAYESLVGSSIHSMIKIETKNILVIDDVLSTFEQDVNLISVGKSELLESISGKANVTQNLFDGQSLLDEDYFLGSNKSMFLLRNHMFKSAAFRCNVQDYLKDEAQDRGIDFNTWEILDYFGNPVEAKNIHMITTPSSLKALKFIGIVGTKKDMWNHWSEVVDKEGSLFGIVKEEKQSKLGTNECGNPIQQMSYQMLNSLPCTPDELSDIASYEYKFVNDLKNDMDVFLKYIEDTADITNGNQMMIDLYKHNPKIACTEMFRHWKSKMINEYVSRIKKGKVKIVNADYAVLLGNPIEMLASAVGKYDESKLALQGNQVYTKMFLFGESLAGFRSPHTSPSNVLSAVNIDNELIGKYLPNLTKNIVVVNCVNHSLQDILSGSDFDSDSLVLTNNKTLSDLAQKCKKEYKVCINDVSSDSTSYTVNNTNMALIDNTLMESQKYIGQVTNVAQLIVSNIWDAVSSGKECEKMWNKLECLTVLSGLCIDLAKRMPKVDIKKQISDAKKTENLLKYKPHWWMIRNKDAAKKGKQKLKEMKKNNIEIYKCPMDFLYEMFTGLEDAPKVKNIDIIDLLSKGNAGDANNAQLNKIDDILEELVASLKCTYKKEVNKEQKKELELERKELTSEVIEIISKLKINKDTMYAILSKTIKNEVDNNTIRMLNVLYQAKKSAFINAFR